jgi:putative transposase
MPKGYPPEFRRRVLDLLDAGRSITEVARDLGISDQTIYNWRRQERIDHGHVAGFSSTEREELASSRRRIRVLEAELAAERRAKQLLREAVPPKGRFAIIHTMVAEGHHAKLCCRVLGVTEGGYYAWRKRAPSPRAIRHAWLTDLIAKVHVDSRGTYGARRVHAELTIGMGIIVGHNAVEMLMRRAGLQGLPNRRRFKTKVQVATAADLVDRSFARPEPDLLWVTDITEHHTREGKVYCSVVLDVFSRRVVGWSIDSSPTAALVTNALGMAIANRDPDGTVIHGATVRNSPLGLSRAARWTLGSFLRWVRSATATTTPSSRPSGQGCRSSCSIAAAG